MPRPATGAGTSQRRRGLAGFAAIAFALFVITSTACVGNLSPGGGWASPVPAGGWIYQASRNGQLFRMGARTGEVDQSWHYPQGKPFGVIYGTPLVTEKAVYAAAYTCRGDQCNAKVFAIDVDTALPVWSEQAFGVDTEIVGPLALHGNTLLFGTSNIGRDKTPGGFLYAIDATPDADKPLAERVGNRLKWRLPVDGKVWGGVTVDGDVAYFGAMDRTVYAVNVSDSIPAAADPARERVLWRFTSNGAIVSKPVVFGDKVYVGDFDGKLYSLDIRSRKGDSTSKTLDQGREWVYEAGAWVWSQPLIHDGVIFFGTLGGQVHAVDPASGRSAWPSPVKLEGEIIGRPEIVRGPGGQLLAVPSNKEDVWLLDLRSGQQIGEFVTRAGVAASPVSREGFVFIHTLDDKLQTFAVSSRARVNCIETVDRKACS
ncbi:MAG: PQQ-binding-like beta-propeller repeat protein [Chloroflexi bacterium]|nr:PQQ-binding-like beta-propeller repeat protein [Chloroflexota bacterium]